MDCFKFCIYRCDLALIVHALPISCTNVEIDTRFKDFAVKDFYVDDATLYAGIHNRNPPMHLCTTIKAVLPRMKYIRLVLNTLCPEIFHSAGSLLNLKEISIDFISPTPVGPRVCGRSTLDAFVSIPQQSGI